LIIDYLLLTIEKSALIINRRLSIIYAVSYEPYAYVPFYKISWALISAYPLTH